MRTENVPSSHSRHPHEKYHFDEIFKNVDIICNLHTDFPKLWVKTAKNFEERGTIIKDFTKWQVLYEAHLRRREKKKKEKKITTTL